MSEDKRIEIEVWTWNRPKKRGLPRLLTICTDIPGVGGTRIAGPKMLPGDATITARFWLDRNAVEAIVEDFERVQPERSSP